ncbi:Lpc [Scenedesmus sp. PABB004]|nr:Lpc [Scenedesmus sp. PABB004]
MVLLLPTVPLRILVCFWSMALVSVVNSLAIWGCDLERPLPRWRRRVVELASQTSTGVFLRAFSFWRPRVVGRENLERGRAMGAIGIFNHVSYLDAFVVVWAWCCAGVTFSFSKDLPVAGYGIRALQNLYVPAERDRSKQAGSMAALIKTRAAQHDMPMLSVAPEGTLSNGRVLLNFKSGAFVAGTPVVPILLRYKLRPASPAWTIPPGSELWHALRLMCQFENRVTVEMLPPYVPSAAERADPALYAANVRRVIVSAARPRRGRQQRSRCAARCGDGRSRARLTIMRARAQADALGVPLVDQDRSHFLALCNARVGVSWDGRRLVAPPGVLDAEGRLDLAPYMPGVFVKPGKAKAQ